ncbi:MAG: UDP-N-acetylmuramate dehydrogenase [Candidatus Omnitrophica bacterium]|nr:UDP-N-acetylmuramate dehydrogenase [Candidatus Omnitrophota bacterium]
MPLKAALSDELTAVTAGRVRFAEPMRLHTTMRVGGPAEVWAEPQSEEELRRLLAIADQEKMPVTVVGGGANLLVRDEGIPGLVLHMGHPFFHGCRRESSRLFVGAGLPLEWLVRRATQEGLSGLEFLAGVPGRMGGAVRMNAGTHDDDGALHQTGDVVRSIRMMDRQGQLRHIPKKLAGFAYRTSRLEGAIVLEAELELVPGDKEEIAGRVKRLWEYKRRTQDWSAPSSGCIFKNPSKEQPAGWLIDRAGLKGFSVGCASVSRIHSNFIINTGGAGASDVFKLIEEIRARVDRRFGVKLELEVQVLPNESEGK